MEGMEICRGAVGGQRKGRGVCGIKEKESLYIRVHGNFGSGHWYKSTGWLVSTLNNTCVDEVVTFNFPEHAVRLLLCHLDS